MLRVELCYKSICWAESFQREDESEASFIARVREEIIALRKRLSQETGRDALIRTLPKSPSGHKKRLIIRPRLFQGLRRVPWPKLLENKKNVSKHFNILAVTEGIEEL